MRHAVHPRRHGLPQRPRLRGAPPARLSDLILALVGVWLLGALALMAAAAALTSRAPTP
ncbi:hypothetical protein [Methylobacterium segetis]|uniref:hypothetical protein n=1 Tax=Methylobacterium segetis TaxID=2488750 RepID=UPI00140558E3|nr:hypothetical protein [Methylobacterium segetis]